MCVQIWHITYINNNAITTRDTIPREKEGNLPIYAKCYIRVIRRCYYSCLVICGWGRVGGRERGRGEWALAAGGCHEDAYNSKNLGWECCALVVIHYRLLLHSCVPFLAVSCTRFLCSWFGHLSSYSHGLPHLVPLAGLLVWGDQLGPLEVGEEEREEEREEKQKQEEEQQWD